MAKVSILMNGYNSQEYLKKAIDSVYAQTFTDWEIIFVDNCSTDSTKEIVDSYDEKIKYHKTPNNIPLGAARNFGLQFCQGEYLAFLDTDDIWLSQKLEKQIKIMESDKEIVLSYGGVEFIDKDDNKTGERIPLASDSDVLAQQLRRYEINMQSVLLRNDREFSIDETLRHAPDFDLFMEIVSTSKVNVIKDIIVKYRVLENSLTSKNIDVWWSEVKSTLDRIFANDKSLKEKYPKEYELAYAKVAYYKARYFLSIDKKTQAREELKKYRFVNKTYFLLYVLLFLPKNIFLAILKLKSTI